MPSLTDLEASIGERYGHSPTAIANSVGVDPTLLLALIQVESGGRQFGADGSLLKSPTGARGLTQLTGIAIQDLADAGKLPASFDPANPQHNLYAGALYLKQQLEATGGDQAEALRAYNVGLAGAAADPDAGRDYAGKVLALMGDSEAPGGLGARLVDDALARLKSLGLGAVAWAVVALLVVFGLWALISSQAVTPA